jgi:Asp-tRNA(Asn)/Glu-tRNA(Gln) amidotransferase A subunit family amidase
MAWELPHACLNRTVRARTSDSHRRPIKRPLVGLTFAAKDLFDVTGQPTGGGNHDWTRWHPVPDKHA